MKLLDEKGLTTVWAAIKGKFINKSYADEKYANKTELQGVKDWTQQNFLSLTGGRVNGDTSFAGNINIRYNINVQGNVSAYHNVSASHFIMNEGTSTQALMANGSVKEIGSANGIATLDSNGYVPLAQLGNLNTTVAEVVTELPTTNIKKHIYLIRDTNGVTQNQYQEYIYTGDTSAVYDASKWERLGYYSIDVDLADYAKKNVAVGNLQIIYTESFVDIGLLDINGREIGHAIMNPVGNSVCGVMTPEYKHKLDGIADNATADSAIAIEEIDALN